jgi:transcriptional regulator with XRE-family HTH domain
MRLQVQARIDAGEITQSAIARATEISQGTISNILSGRKSCSLFTLCSIAEAAGIQATVRLVKHDLRAQRFEELDRAIARDRQPI